MQIYLTKKGTKFLKTVLLITAIPFLIAASCNKNTTRPCYNFTPYSFVATAEWQPQKIN